MSGMFQYSKFKGDISQWDMSNVTDKEYMFDDDDDMIAENDEMFDEDDE
jgi:hypothetical protein